MAILRAISAALLFATTASHSLRSPFQTREGACKGKVRPGRCARAHTLPLRICRSACVCAAFLCTPQMNGWGSLLPGAVRACLASTCLISPPLTPTPQTYDYYELVQQWSIALCSDGTFTCQSSSQFFTLHGMWPQLTDGDWPCTCTNEAFDPAAVASIMPQLETYWVSLNGPTTTFLGHEWTKHGTCAEDVFPTQLDYFSGVLSLLSKFNATVGLAAAGIVPSNAKAVPLTAFKDAINKYTNGTVAVTCDSSGYVTGLIQCITKAGKSMDCPANVPDACSSSNVYLLASQK